MMCCEIKNECYKKIRSASCCAQQCKPTPLPANPVGACIKFKNISSDLRIKIKTWYVHRKWSMIIYMGCCIQLSKWCLNRCLKKTNFEAQKKNAQQTPMIGTREVPVDGYARFLPPPCACGDTRQTPNAPSAQGSTIIYPCTFSTRQRCSFL
jgi:hypothetical protein